MRGIVAIVGRPNVGKSTLFNRLVGKRISITFKDPGITRDRIYKATSWMDRSFILVDTGGMIPSAFDALLISVRTQVEIAIGEADLILFMVDAKEGLSPLDEEIVQLLYKKGFLLVVNKMDVKEAKANLSEFCKLGVDRIFPISAEHGQGIVELLDEIVEKLPQPLKSDDKEIARFVILGRPNVGKSSFLNAILGEERVIVDEAPGTTRDAIEASFRFGDKRYKVIDTAGIRRKAKVKKEIEYFSVVRAIRNIEGSDIAILMIDAREGVTAQDKKIVTLVEDRGKGIVIAANKSDFLTREELKNFKAELYYRVSFLRHIPIVLTSATEKKGVKETMKAVELVFSEANKRIEKNTLRDTILPEIERHPSKVKVFSISQTDVRPPTFLLKIKGSVSGNFIQFIKNALRSYFGFRGNPIRIKLKR